MSLKGINDAVLKIIDVHVFTTNFGMKEIDEGSVPREVKYLGKSSVALLLTAIKRIRNYDIVQLSSVFYFPNLVLIWIAFILGKRIILSPRGELFAPALDSSRKFIKLLILFILRPIAGRILFVATAEQEKRQILKFFNNSEVKVIPNAAKFPKYYSPKRVRSKLVFVGRLSPIKNIELIIEALSQYENEKIVLVIIGESWTRDEKKYKQFLEELILEKGLGNRVIFKGHIDGAKKYTEIAESTCLIVPSFSENFGNVVLESLYTGTPVITTNTTPWEYLSYDGLGRSIDSDSVFDLVEGIKHFVNMSDQDFDSISIKCSKHWEENYTIETIGEKWLKIFKLCVE